MRTRVLTIVLTDLCGWTARQSRASRQEIEADVRRHRALLEPIFVAYGGRIVKSLGDGFLVAFESPTDAVHASVHVQQALRDANASGRGDVEPQQVRVAVSTGEVTEDDAGDVFGEPVNLAARLEEVAEPGTVLLTEATFLSMNRNEIPAMSVGRRVFRGIPQEVTVYRVEVEALPTERLRSRAQIEGAARRTARKAPGSRGWDRTRWAFVGGALAVAAGAAALWPRGGPPAPTAGDLVGSLAAAAAKDPAQVALVAGLLRASVERLLTEGRFEEARGLARRATDAVPGLAGPRDFWLEVNRRELEAARASGSLTTLVRERPPVWYREHVEALDARFRDAPRYRWLRATWFLAAEPTSASTAALVEEALAAEPDALRSAAFAAALWDAARLAAADPALAERYRASAARVDAARGASPGVTPTPAGTQDDR